VVNIKLVVGLFGDTNGHEFIALNEGPIPLFKIDNIIYEAIPQAVNMQVPIQGCVFFLNTHFIGVC